MTPTVIDNLFAALDMSGLQAKQEATLLIGVALVLGFAAFKLIKKLGSRTV